MRTGLGIHRVILNWACGLGLLLGLGNAAWATDVLTLKQTAADLQRAVHCLDNYYADCGHYPTTKEGLQALLVKPRNHRCAKWGNEPPKIPGQRIVRTQAYLSSIPTDNWGHTWRYSSSDYNKYQLISLGADGKPGGAGEDADVTSVDFLKSLPSGITVPARCFDEN